MPPSAEEQVAEKAAEPAAGSSQPAVDRKFAEPEPQQAIPQDGEPDVSTIEPARQPSGPQISTNVQNSQMRDLSLFVGNNNAIVQMLGSLQDKQGREEQCLLDFVVDLPELRSNDWAANEFSEKDLVDHAEGLATERLLILSCSEPSLSLAAAAALIERLGINKKSRKLLNFEAVPPSIAVHVRQLYQRSLDAESDGEVILVVQALADTAQPFIGSILKTGAGYSCPEIREGLASHGLLVVVIADSQMFSVLPEGITFDHWAISSLEYLLRPRFPARFAELASKITTQRNNGRWNRDENDFRRQVTSFTDEELVAAVESGGPKPASDTARLAEGDQSPVHLAVLYTATFYPDLAPTEFARVVTTVLGDEMVIPEKVQQKGSDGTSKPEEIQGEKRLVQVWNERSDAILRECRLITTREASREGNRIVVFADAGRRDQLRRLFEEEFGMYIETRFARAWRNGLIFDTSERIAADVIGLTIEMVTTDSNQFGRDWLLNNLEQSCSASTDSVAALRVFGKLFRSLLAEPEPRLNAVVVGVVESLLQTGRHDYALELVKNLRFATGFDDLYWLKQLIDRGVDAVRMSTSNYLYGEVRRRGIGVFRELARWLPLPGRDPLTYSPSNAAALRLMLQYCLETTERFSPENYGLRPTRFPLLLSDVASADDDFALLVQFLLHPGIKAVVNDAWPDPDVLALLVSRWVFILFGYGPIAAAAAEDPFPPEAVLRVLVEQLIEGTRKPELRHLRQAMVESWEGMSDVFALAPGLLGAEGRRRRQEFVGMRTLVKKLITEFRRLQRDLRPVARQQATA